MNAGAPTRAIVAWTFYDWANSAFPTLVITFVYATYFTQAIAPDPVSGTSGWAWTMGTTGIAIALLSPVLGAAADRKARRLPYLMATTGVAVAATALLTFVAPKAAHATVLALLLVGIANVAFEVGMVFYNAFLPTLAPPGRVGFISGAGWGLGYMGGLLCLLLALAVLVRPDPLLGIPIAGGFNYRATNLLVAAWYLVFSLPMFLFVREPPAAAPDRERGGGWLDTARGLGRTFGEILRYPQIPRFLIARLVYNDGLVTVFAFGGIYAAGTFGMSLSEVIEFGIVINVAAGLGAWLFGLLDDRVGPKLTVQVTLVALALLTALAVAAPSKAWLWVAAIGIGIFVGPNQSASRSLMARLVPLGKQSEFFGFFAVSGKVTAFIGPFLLGGVTAWADSQRAGVATVIAFFVIGSGLLARVDVARGLDDASATERANLTGGPE